MNVGSLFSGIGGMDLGLERSGMRVIWQSEIDPYASTVLARHWPAVPNLGDIRGIDWAGVERPDVVAGGFPCQPVSSVGERRAVDDPRWLWPEFARCVRELGPRYVIVENVTGLFDRGMGEVLGELAALGFDAEWSVLSACAMGAPHARERVFIVAHPQSERLEWAGLPVAPAEALLAGQGRGPGMGRHWADEPRPNGVAYGVPRRVGRLWSTGNAVVPQVAQWIGERLMESAQSDGNRQGKGDSVEG